MSTTMHRLQISLPQWELQFVAARARRDRISIAEVIRQLVEREAQAHAVQSTTDSLWSIAGIAEDHAPLIAGVAVSERPELYVVEALLPRAQTKPVRKKAAAKRKVAGRR